MKLDLLILAIAPVATIILWIYLKDKYDKEPIRVLSKFFILGILVSILAIYAEEILIKTRNDTRQKQMAGYCFKEKITGEFRRKRVCRDLLTLTLLSWSYT